MSKICPVGEQTETNGKTSESLTFRPIFSVAADNFRFLHVYMCNCVCYLFVLRE